MQLLLTVATSYSLVFNCRGRSEPRRAFSVRNRTGKHGLGSVTEGHDVVIQSRYGCGGRCNQRMLTCAVCLTHKEVTVQENEAVLDRERCFVGPVLAQYPTCTHVHRVKSVIVAGELQWEILQLEQWSSMAGQYKASRTSRGNSTSSRCSSSSSSSSSGSSSSSSSSSSNSRGGSRNCRIEVSN